MNTYTNHDDDLKKGFEDLFKPRSEDIEVKHDALMLMAGFLSEIEIIQDEQGVSRKDLAKEIGTSGSYLTQVFRSKKPLNFITLAKIKRALGIRFEIRAFPKNLPSTIESDNHQYTPLCLATLAKESLSITSDTIPAEGSTFHNISIDTTKRVFA
jgi:transcriptional regulator with XRE-family HTH domain